MWRSSSPGMRSSRPSATRTRPPRCSAASNDRLARAATRAQYSSGMVQPLMVLIANLNYIAVAVVGALQVTAGSHDHRRHPGVHPVQPALHPACGPDRRPAERHPVLRRFGSAVSSTSWTPRSSPPNAGTAAAAERRSGRPHCLRRRHFRLRRSAAPAVRGPVLHGRTGPDRGDCRPHRRGEDHRGQPPDAVLRTRVRPDHHWRNRHRRHAPGRPAGAASAWCSRTPGCSPAPSGRTSPTAGREPRTRKSLPPRRRATWTTSSGPCLRATTPCWTTAATPSARASAS